MRSSRVTESQVIKIVRQAEAGLLLETVARQPEISMTCLHLESQKQWDKRSCADGCERLRVGELVLLADVL